MFHVQYASNPAYTAVHRIYDVETEIKMELPHIMCFHMISKQNNFHDLFYRCVADISRHTVLRFIRFTYILYLYVDLLNGIQYSVFGIRHS